MIRRWDSIVNASLCGSFVNAIFLYIVATLFVALFIIPTFTLSCHRYMLLAWETVRRREVAEAKEHEKLVKKDQKEYAMTHWSTGWFSHGKDHKPLIPRPHPW